VKHVGSQAARGGASALLSYESAAQHACLQRCRVPAECPQGVADLIAACMSELAADRPTAAEVAELLAGDAEELNARRIKPFRMGGDAEYAPVCCDDDAHAQSSAICGICGTTCSTSSALAGQSMAWWPHAIWPGRCTCYSMFIAEVCHCCRLPICHCCRLPIQTSSLSLCAQVHVTQNDKEECVQRYDDAFTFYYGTFDAALEAGYTCAQPPQTFSCGHGHDWCSYEAVWLAMAMVVEC
jgi:hypothetical protein